MEQSKTRRSAALREDSRDFLANPLGAHLADFRRHPAHGGPRPGLNGVSKSCTESDSSQQPEFVLGKAFLRVADGTHYPVPDVSLAGDIVDDMLLHRIVEQAVDGEVAAQDIRLGIGEGN